MKKIIQHLRRIEAAVYPEAYRLMAYYEVSSWVGLAAYCQGRPRIEAWADGYAIWTGDEIVDIASLSPVPLLQLREILRKMAKTFGSNVFSADCREDTSYKLVQVAARKGILEVIEDEEYSWAGEKFHAMELRFLPRRTV